MLENRSIPQSLPHRRPTFTAPCPSRNPRSALAPDSPLPDARPALILDAAVRSTAADREGASGRRQGPREGRKQAGGRP
jgi:hypothetical protein